MTTKASGKKHGDRSLGGWMWMAIGLYSVFFLGVAVQRMGAAWMDLPAAIEAALLVAATACFISGCLRLESRQSSTP
jgi:hypothetical protein